MSLSKKTEGILWAVVSSFWIALMLCTVRYVSTYYNAYVIVFWRLLFSLLFMCPWLLKNGLKALKTERIKLYSFRAVIGIIAMLIWFYALGILSLPQATALSFTGPIFTTIAAIWVLKEKPSTAKLLSILVGFIGVIIIVRPGIAEFNSASFLVLSSTALWAVAAIAIKKLSATEAPQAITFYMASMMAPMAFIPAAIFWQEVAVEHLFWMAIIGLTSNFAHTALSRSLSKTCITTIMPYDFTRLVFVGVLAYFIFGDETNIYDVLGSLVIISSSIYITHRESRAQVRKRELKRMISD